MGRPKKSLKKRVLFLTVGSTSAGNHLAVRILMLMGCVGNSGALPDGVQREFDLWAQGYSDIIPLYDRVVWWKVVAYQGFYEDLSSYKRRLEENGYEVKTIYVMRNWTTMIESARYRHPRRKKLEIAFDKALKENIHILNHISLMQPVFIMNTSMLFEHPQLVINRLEQFTELKFPKEGYELIRMETDSKWKK